jgi:protein-disulfide isomerase
MAAWDAAYQDPATLDRINADVADGQALGVTGTPSFFIDGQRLQPQSYQDLTDALDAALG